MERWNTLVSSYTLIRNAWSLGVVVLKSRFGRGTAALIHYMGTVDAGRPASGTELVIGRSVMIHFQWNMEPRRRRRRRRRQCMLLRNSGACATCTIAHCVCCLLRPHTKGRRDFSLAVFHSSHFYVEGWCPIDHSVHLTHLAPPTPICGRDPRGTLEEVLPSGAQFMVIAPIFHSRKGLSVRPRPIEGRRPSSRESQ